MGSVVHLTKFRKLHIPDTSTRIELLEGDKMQVTFVGISRPAIICHRSDLPDWLLDRIDYMQERVSPYASCEFGSRFGDNVFYIP